MKHAKEPWIAIEQDRGFHELIITTQSRINSSVGEICGMNIHFRNPMGDEQKANARRIVAAVNACAGVPTELLEEYPAPFSEMRAERDQLLAQRDMLIQQNARLTQDGLENLEALGKVVRQRDKLMGLLRKFDSIMDGCGNWPDTSTSQVNLGDLVAEVRAAIAAVKGGAA